MSTPIKKVTLELIYDAVDERTQEIKDRLDALHSEMNNRSGEINARFDQLFSLIVTQRKES